MLTSISLSMAFIQLAQIGSLAKIAQKLSPLMASSVRRVPITRVSYILSYGSFGMSRRMLTIDDHIRSADDVQDLLENRHPGSA